MFKDPQFRSTGAYVISMVLMMPLSYAIQTLIIGLIFKTLWIWLAYFATLLPTGVYMLHYMFENRKWRSRIRLMWMLGRKSKDARKLLQLRKEIVAKMDKLVGAM
jgi:hypothetical protein